MEHATLEVSDVTDDMRDSYLGRAGGLGSRLTKARPSPGRARMRFAPAEHWGVCTTLVGRYLALRLHRADFRQQRKCLKDLVAQLSTLKALPQDEVFGKKVLEIERQEAYELGGRLGSLEVQQVQALFARFEKYHALAQAR
eukprot:1691172-Pyramimonas_sp.AAC.1